MLNVAPEHWLIVDVPLKKLSAKNQNNISNPLKADRHGLLSLPVTPVTPCCSSKRRSPSSICDLSLDPVGKTEYEKRSLITVRLEIVWFHYA